ncbi:efflux RND transporter permease subunit [Anaerotignum sp. MB30-C6]|uniref:efflux RND transporter permease subunit n=1 Tax=Anaerotignum sp. MB30-C6 TaxID=3070814 RepID=UPI0027DE2E54|nr:efflux RND transporter permease subunit [Anaerotignum sp. MB30-C6]WMI82695.1 efflux RND transporter permease subunit [Anaerotignum sp. MB30-C6]
MIGGITARVLKNKKLTIFIMVFVLLAGVYSYVKLPRQENPDISAPMAQIFIRYPGSSSLEVEKYVIKPIEDKIVELEGFDYSESVSRNGVGSVFLKLMEDIDTDKAWDDLAKLMDEVKMELPQEVSEITVNTDLTQTPGMIISLSSNSYDADALADYGDYLKNSLSQIDGVKKFEVIGEVQKQVEIIAKPIEINQWGLTSADLISKIQGANVSIPQGSVESQSGRIQLTVKNKFEDINYIENISVASSGITENLKLKDVADVKVVTDPYAANYGRNGTRTVFLVGYFEDTLNVVTVGKEVDSVMDSLNKNIPNDIEFNTLMYQPEDVDNAVKGFMKNLFQAVFFVLLVVLFGMGKKNAIVVSTAIPLSIAFTMIVMYIAGVKLENMSIAGLIIALGMLVDNAIVVSDAIQHHLDQGVDPDEAAILGTKEVSFSILTSTLTTIFAFMPLLLLKSTLGEFIYGVPFVVTVSLIGSYICAIITIPVISSLVLKPSIGQQKEKKSRIRQFYMNTLRKTLGKAKYIYIAAVVFVLIGFTAASSLVSSILPKADKSLIQIDIQSEFSSDIKKTEQLKDQVITLLSDMPELTNYYSSVGSNLPKFYMSVQYRAPEPSIGQLAYEFDLSKSQRFVKKEDLQAFIQERLRENLIGGSASTYLLDLASISTPIQFRLIGTDLERLDQVSSELSEVLHKTPGTMNVSDNFKSREYQFQVEIQEMIASARGLSEYGIQKELSTALLRQPISQIKKNGKHIPIFIHYDIEDKDEVSNLMIKSPISQDFIALDEVAEIQLDSQYPVINHYNGQRSVTITSDLMKGYSVAEVERNIKEHIEGSNYEDIQFEFNGMMAKLQENNASLGQLALFSIFMILAVLILQFHSYSQPIVVLSTVPIAVAAALLGLSIARQPLSFVAMLSLVSLMGIVVNNAIVLIDAIKFFCQGGMELKQACITAVNRRYRPIMLSTITTVIGLIPLLISGGELFRPLAVSLISGLTFSTFITILIIPNLFLSITNARNKWRRKS